MEKIKLTDCIPSSKDKIQTYTNDNESAKYYGTYKWHVLRALYIRQNPLCEECMKDGIYSCATEVHHKIPFMSVENEEARWDLLLDKNNLMSLCYDCHKKMHKHKRPWKHIHNKECR